MRYSLLLAAVATCISAAAYSKALEGIPAGKPTTDATCAQAIAYMTARNFKNIEEYNQFNAVFNKCNAQDIKPNSNKKKVLAVGQAKEDLIVIYDLVEIDPDDVEGIRMVCDAMSEVVGATKSGLTGTLFTVAGRYSCKSYIDAALRSDPLLIVSPMLVPGIDVTKDLLRAAGVPDKTIKDMEKRVGDVAKAGLRQGVHTGTAGVVVVDKELRCAKILGKRVCR